MVSARYEEQAEKIELAKYGKAYQEELLDYAVFLGLNLEEEEPDIEKYTSDRNEQVVKDELALLDLDDISDMNQAIERLGALQLDIAEDKQRELYRKKQDAVVSQGKLTEGVYVTDETLNKRLEREKEEIQRIYREIQPANAASIQNGRKKDS